MTHITLNHLPLEVAVFATVDDARRAVDSLRANGFSDSQITVVCSEQTKEKSFRQFEHQEPAGTHATKAAVAGGAVGAVVGGASVLILAAATGSLALVAAGPISAWAGGVAGGFVGAMMTRGVEKELANFYQQAVVDGNILVAAEAPADNHQLLDQAARLLADAGAIPLALSKG
jgi:hypothetical protein